VLLGAFLEFRDARLGVLDLRDDALLVVRERRLGRCRLGRICCPVNSTSLWSRGKSDSRAPDHGAGGKSLSGERVASGNAGSRASAGGAQTHGVLLFSRSAARV